jgi:hypothetical protein
MKAGAAKPRVLASSATPAQAATDATKDPKIAEPPKGRSAFVLSGPETSRGLHSPPEAWLEIGLMRVTYDWSTSSQCHGG